jgi:hypothetical protein
MSALLERLRHELGPAGLAAAFLLALAGAFLLLMLQPLQERARVLETALARAQPSAAAGASGGLGEFYRFFDTREQTTDWLARLHAIARATGVELASASYRSSSPGGRLERYEIVLPLAGGYGRIREFLARALADIPVLSLDQMTLKRESRGEGVVQAELRLTLHRLKP